MHNIKGKAPIVVIVCDTAKSCDLLSEQIRSFAPYLRIGRVTHCDLRRSMRNLVSHDAPLVAFILNKPKPTGHVDTVPSGIAQILTTTAQEINPNLKPFHPTIILRTSADTDNIKRMTRSISPLSGIPEEKIHVVRPDSFFELAHILKSFKPARTVAPAKNRTQPKRISSRRLRGSRRVYALLHLHLQG